MKKFSMGVIVSSLSLIQAGCGEQAPVTTPPAAAAVEHAADAADKAKDAVVEGVEDATGAAKDAADAVVEGTADAAKEGAEAAGDAADAVKEAAK